MPPPESPLSIDAWPFQLDEFTPRPVSHPEDAARAAVISDPLRKIRTQRARAALRRVLGLRLGMKPELVALEIAAGGKPFVAGCEFSISHSGPWLAVVVSGSAVGVDVESQRPRRNAAEIAARFFSARDILSLQETEAARREIFFLRQWVAKEAALKAAGVGLSAHLHKAECVLENSSVRGVRWDAERFAIHEFSLRDGTPGAVAWRGDGPAQIKWRDPAEANVS